MLDFIWITRSSSPKALTTMFITLYRTRAISGRWSDFRYLSIFIYVYRLQHRPLQRGCWDGLFKLKYLKKNNLSKAVVLFRFCSVDLFRLWVCTWTNYFVEEVGGTLEGFYCQHTVSVYFYTLDLQQLILGSLPFRFAVYTLQCVCVCVCCSTDTVLQNINDIFFPFGCYRIVRFKFMLLLISCSIRLYGCTFSS